MSAVARVLLKWMLHPAERDEVLADVMAEYRSRTERDGAVMARMWIWGQVVGSVPAAIKRSWFRGRTGFESEANRMKAGGLGLESWIMDARFALRSVRSRPLYLLLSVLTLALGIGGTTAIFGVVRAVLMNPLPYRASDELVMFWNTFDWSEAELAFLKDDWTGFAKVAGYRPEAVFLRQEGSPARLVPGIATSAELFDVLGTQPMMGRGFRNGDDVVGAEPSAVISYGLWQELGGDPNTVGSVVQLDGAPRRVLGVMPAGFWFPDPSVRVWLSQGLRPDSRSGMYALVGRRASGLGLDAMSDPLRRITGKLAGQFTYSRQWDKTKNAQLTPLREYLLGPVRPALLATMAGMGVILLMACANVATLMLGQLRGRSSELAVRMAIGAGRRRLTQQLLVESAILGLLAGVFGAIAALSGFKLLLAALPLGELSESVTADWSLFGVALVIALLSSLLIAMAPVFSLWQGDIRQALSQARSGGISAHGGRLEDVLVISEVAMAVLLAASAGVLIRSVQNLSAVDSGIDARSVAVLEISASSEVPWQQRWPQVDQMMKTLRALPGVNQVATVQRLPLIQGDNWGVTVEGKPDLERSTTAFRMVSRDYFSVFRIPLKKGRLFDASDHANSEPVVVIDEAFARKYFPNEDPIGRRISHGLVDGFARIIGVVGNVAHQSLTGATEPGRYILMDQTGFFYASVWIVMRASADRDLAMVLNEARTTIQHNVTTFAVQEATTMDNRVALAMGPTRRIMQLMTLLGGLALTLGAIGVYGVVSHFVNRRKRDWVIKMALGMKPLSAVEQVVTRGATLVSIGSAIGVVAAVLLTGFLRSLLYQVDAADPLALLAAAGTLIATGCIAALVPGIRASRANPAAVLRESA